jgi:hypothetical protein
MRKRRSDGKQRRRKVSFTQRVSWSNTDDDDDRY